METSFFVVDECHDRVVRSGWVLPSLAYESSSIDFGCSPESYGLAHRLLNYCWADRIHSIFVHTSARSRGRQDDRSRAGCGTGGATQIALLQCTSVYPATPDDMNLRTIPELAKRFGVPAGLSDHTMGSVVALAAVTLGACIIEKHITLSRSLKGPDREFSLDALEFKAMVDTIRATERALGTVHFGVSEQEASSRAFRRSLFVVQDLRCGEPFTNQNVRSIGPAHGLHTRHLAQVLGKRLSRDILRGAPLDWDLVEN